MLGFVQRPQLVVVVAALVESAEAAVLDSLLASSPLVVERVDLGSVR